VRLIVILYQFDAWVYMMQYLAITGFGKILLQGGMLNPFLHLGCRNEQSGKVQCWIDYRETSPRGKECAGIHIPNIDAVVVVVVVVVVVILGRMVRSQSDGTVRG